MKNADKGGIPFIKQSFRLSSPPKLPSPRRPAIVSCTLQTAGWQQQHIRPPSGARLGRQKLLTGLIR